MAHVFAITYTRPIPSTGKIFLRDGQKFVTWTGRRGDPVEGKVSEDGKRCTVITGRWGVEYTDHTGKRRRVACGRDYKVADRKRVDIERTEDAIGRGDRSAASVKRGGRPLTVLLSEWQTSITDNGKSQYHADQYHGRAAKVFTGIGAAQPADLDAGRVTAELARLRRAGEFGTQTSNHYLTACRAFSRWCVEAGYLDADPLTSCRPVPIGKRTFERRPLTPDELERLIRATTGRTASRCAVKGPDRAVAYLVVAYTGFRLAELARLVPESFRLDEAPPVVILGPSKGKPGVSQAIPDSIVPRLRAYLKDKPPGVKLWCAPGWSKGRKATVTLKGDLKAAGIEYETAAGVVNFHALRTTYATWLARAGVPLQVVQRLMRHSSPTTTAAHYIRLGLTDYASELIKLPSPPAPPV
jgi:integrase